jgi:ABC-type branched-subunit amino acid transport system ATPase component
VEIVAEGVAVRGRAGTVVGAVDLDVRPGTCTVLAGPAGSGRTALLLALGARFATARGRISVDGTPLPRGADAARPRIAVARAAPAVELEGLLTVGELAAERRAIGGPHVTERSLVEAFDLVDLPYTPRVLARELSQVEQLLLALALAAAEQPGGILVDDVDEGIAGTDLERAWYAVRALADSGPTVVATATAPPPPGPTGADLVLVLPGHETHRRTRSGGRR